MIELGMPTVWALTRRGALRAVAIIAATMAAQRGRRAWAACTTTPSAIEGPYWVDERLERSDIRIDPSTGLVEPGVPLRLTIRVSRADSECAPAGGAQVDIWHCDAGGLYSDETANHTTGRKFLRGYQVTDEDGQVEFTTIYPGWYRGRTIHIHFRVRTFAGAVTTYDFTSQWYFDDAVSDVVLAQAPYDRRGPRDTRNSDDGIFDGATMLALSTDDSGGYVGSFDVALAGLPASDVTPIPSATATENADTSTPTPTSTPVVQCPGDCNGDDRVAIDELVTLVDTALGSTPASACAEGIPTGASIDVSLLIQAVHRALTGCG